MNRKENSQDIFNRLTEELKNGKIYPVYFICGEEQFYTDAAQEIVLKLMPDHEKDFNLDVFYGQDVSTSQIISAAKSFPMMGERRMVVVREFSNLFSRENDSEESSSYEELIPYIEKPSPNTVLVFIDVKKPAGNTKFGRALSQLGHVSLLEFQPIPDFQVTKWIKDRARTYHNRSISDDAAEYLYQLTGSNLSKLSTELEKVCTFNKTLEAITRDDVKSVTNISRQFTGFELKDAVVKRDLKKSLFIAEQLLQNGQSDYGEVLRNIGLLFSTFTAIWQFKQLQAKGITPKQIQQEMGMSPYRLKYVMEEAAAFSLAEMPMIFESFLDADKSLKGFSKLDTNAIFIMLIRKIIA